jgi:hypothetical protein
MLQVGQWLGRKFDTLRLLSHSQGGQFVLFFSGNAAGALWVAPLPERGEAGGLYVLRASPLRHDDGRVEEFPLQSKYAVGWAILDRVAERLIHDSQFTIHNSGAD